MPALVSASRGLIPLAALAVAAGCALVSPRAEADERPRACPPATADRVLARSRPAVLFTGRSGALRACARPHGRARLLGGRGDSPTRTWLSFTPRAAGALVAYGEMASEYGVRDFRVNVFDVRRRQFVARLPTGDPAQLPPEAGPPPTGVGVGPSLALELLRDGTVAWVAGVGDSGLREVWLSDAQGTRLLSRSAGVVPRSLELSGTTVSWVEGGRSRTAPVVAG